MAPSRDRRLPEKRNPFMMGRIDNYADLVSKRRLGQTQLTAKMVANLPNTKLDPNTLGVFDYAHLRAPLPKGIVSGIFKSSPNSYFLMRRSHDGFVSATGMFKATFPYAMAEDEEAERKFVKSLPNTSAEETAGNVWIPAESALVLAEEYGIKEWIKALLDPAEILPSPSNSDSPSKKISAPPKFTFRGHSPTTLVPPTPTSTRNTRSRRSASPSKAATKRGTASPRKRSARLTASQTDSETPSSSRMPSLTNGDIPVLAPGGPLRAEEVKRESVETETLSQLETVEEEPRVKVNIRDEVKTDDDGTEVKHTEFEMEVPTSVGEVGLSDGLKMLQEAQAMVAAAEAAETLPSGPTSKNSAKSKRKAEDFEADNEPEEGALNGESSSALQPRAKRAKTEIEAKKQKIKKRAVWGISLTLLVGAASVFGPYAMNLV
ncbi:unnamed protein product [Discula destructiva]